MDPEEKEGKLELEPDTLEISLEEVAGANYEQDNDNKDNGDVGGGRMQLALRRRDKDENQFEGEEEDTWEQRQQI